MRRGQALRRRLVHGGRPVGARRLLLSREPCSDIRTARLGRRGRVH